MKNTIDYEEVVLKKVGKNNLIRWVDKFLRLFTYQNFLFGCIIPFFILYSFPYLCQNQNENSPPTIKIIGVEDGGWYNSDVKPVIKIEGNNLDPQKTIILLNDKPFVSETVIKEENFYLFYVSTQNDRGEKHSKRMYFVIDKTPPIIRITRPYVDVTFTKDGKIIAPLGVNQTPFKIEGVVEDIAPKEVIVNGKDHIKLINGYEFSFSREFKEGLNEIKFEAVDKAGNIGRLNLQIRLKTTKPFLKVLSPAEGSIVSEGVIEIEGECSDDTKKVTIDSEPAILENGKFFLPDFYLKKVENKISIKAKDFFENEKETFLNVIRDDIPPKILIDNFKEEHHTKEAKFGLSGKVLDFTDL